MNPDPDSPQSPREELEMRITALLLGQLSEEEAAAVRQAIQADPELQRLHNQLRQTIGLVRETAVSPGREGLTASEEPRLSAERRAELLATFKVVRPKELARREQRRVQRRDLGLVAAMLIALLTVAGLVVAPSFFSPGTYAQREPEFLAVRPESDEYTYTELSKISGLAAKGRAAVSAGRGVEYFAEDATRVGDAVGEEVKLGSVLARDVRPGKSGHASITAGTAPAQTAPPEGGVVLAFEKQADPSAGVRDATTPIAGRPAGGTGTGTSDGLGAPQNLPGGGPPVAAVPQATVSVTPSDEMSRGERRVGRSGGIALPARIDESEGQQLHTWASTTPETLRPTEGVTAFDFDTGRNGQIAAAQKPASPALPAPQGPAPDGEVRRNLYSTVTDREQPPVVSPSTGLPMLGNAPVVGGLFDNISADKFGVVAGGAETGQAGQRPRSGAVGASAGSYVGGLGGAPTFGNVPPALPATPAADAANPEPAKPKDYVGVVITEQNYQPPVGAQPAERAVDEMLYKSVEAAGAAVAPRPGQPKLSPVAKPDAAPIPIIPPQEPDVRLNDFADAPSLPMPVIAPQGDEAKKLPAKVEAEGKDSSGFLRYDGATGADAKAKARTEGVDVGLTGITQILQEKRAMLEMAGSRETHRDQRQAQVQAPEVLARLEQKEALTELEAKAAAVPQGTVGGVISDLVRPLPRKTMEPGPVAPRRTAPNAPVPQPEILTADNPYSTFSLNVSDVSFKLAAASLEKGQMPDVTTIRTEEFINAFDYRDPEPVSGQAVAFNWERARYPYAHNRDLVRLSVKTAASGRQAGRPLNLVLLLDNSGSMERADRIRIRQECLRVLATQLQPQDRVSVVSFARTPRLWVDGLSGNQAGELSQRVGTLTPEGGTNLEEAMRLAYQTARRHFQPAGINRVVLLTDGAANLGDVEPDSLKKQVETNRRQGVALDCFGIGWDGYNDDLLETLSRNGDGRYGFLNTPEAASSEFAGQLAGALRVAASDVKVQVQFNPRRVTAYRQMGYAKHQLKKEQFRDNTVDAAEIGAAEAGNALYVVEVNPRGEGPLGVARVRFKVPGTQEYREQEWTLAYDGAAKAFEQSAPTLRLAGVAAAFSEWLAASPFAAEVTTATLLGHLRGVPETYAADPRPKKLEWMLRQAGSAAGK